MQGFYTLIGFSFVAGGCLLARTNSTAILGTVVDPSGAIVVGAKVTPLNLGTAIKCQDTSSASGDYILRNHELDATPKNQLRQNQCGGVFSGPPNFCTRLIEFSKGVV
jgi:hypothetical protein